MIMLIEYPPCTTCKKAKKWLSGHGFSFETRHIKENPPTKEELSSWHEQYQIPLRRFFNTSGQRYRQLELKEKLPGMTEEEMLDLLASDGMLVKRPVLLTEKGVLVGFREQEWEKLL